MIERKSAIPERIGRDVEEVARALGSDHKTVRKEIAAGNIPSFRIGRTIKIPEWWYRQHLEGIRNA